jgi:hypothetical protein
LVLGAALLGDNCDEFLELTSGVVRIAGLTGPGGKLSAEA